MGISLLAATAVTVMTPAASTPAHDVVLVHGAVMDGSGWRAVYDRLRASGLHVAVVQLPLTGLDDDVAATRAVIDRQKGPVVLVGHSYGGAIVSVAGNDPKVQSLVYVAAFQPDKGESVAKLGARFPVPAHPQMVSAESMIVDPAHFRTDVAADLPEGMAAFLADAQRPTAVSSFTTTITDAAWRTKPSYAIVARQDRTISPDLERFMAKRARSYTIEFDGSHAVYMSKPAEVAAFIATAAKGRPARR